MTTIRTAALLLLAGVALGNAGCLVAAVGAAAAAGAAGYAHVKGKVCHTVNATLDETVAAARQSLAELKMPITSEGRQTGSSAWLDSATADGTTVSITVDVEPAEHPPQANVTRLCVRVGAFGDYPTSDRIITQIMSHLPNATAAGPPLNPIQPVSAQNPNWVPAPPPPSTAPPPLLPPEPAKK